MIHLKLIDLKLIELIQIELEITASAGRVVSRSNTIGRTPPAAIPPLATPHDLHTSIQFPKIRKFEYLN